MPDSTRVCATSNAMMKVSDEISARIRTYDNNLGFFKNAKGSNFIEEVQGKVDAEKAKLAELAAKRKLVNEEVSRLSKAEKTKAEA